MSNKTQSPKAPTKGFLSFVAKKKILTDQAEIRKFIEEVVTADYDTPVKALHLYKHGVYINENMDGTFGFPMFNDEYEGTLEEMEAKLWSLAKNGI